MWLKAFHASTPPAPPGRRNDERKNSMDNRGKRQASSLFGGMGFYIALLVCVVAAGVVGYFALLRNDPAPDPAPVSTADPEPVQDVAGPSSEPAAPVTGTAPIIVERPTVQSVTEPEEESPAPPPAGKENAIAPEEASSPKEENIPVMEPAPIQAVEPVLTVVPLVGDTVAVFSVDHLSYDATLGDWRTHDGIDIQAAAGTTVVAAAAGVVLSVEEDGRMGTTVTLDHGSGCVSTYASLQPEVPVRPGDAVEAGAAIGLVGNTSLTEAGLGAHLHFGVSQDGEPLDPAEFLGE